MTRRALVLTIACAAPPDPPLAASTRAPGDPPTVTVHLDRGDASTPPSLPGAPADVFRVFAGRPPVLEAITPAGVAPTFWSDVTPPDHTVVTWVGRLDADALWRVADATIVDGVLLVTAQQVSCGVDPDDALATDAAVAFVIADPALPVTIVPAPAWTDLACPPGLEPWVDARFTEGRWVF